MADAQNNQKNQQQDLNQILKVRREKLAALQEVGKDPFRHVKYDVTAHSRDIVEGFEELEGKTVSIAGRIMFKRVMGKASFCNVQDLKGSIQVYVARDNIVQAQSRFSPASLRGKAPCKAALTHITAASSN